MFKLLLGFRACKGGQRRFESTWLTQADFEDWRFVDLEPAGPEDEPTKFFDLDALRQASRVKLVTPRVGFFTTPAFFANWETNQDN